LCLKHVGLVVSVKNGYVEFKGEAKQKEVTAVEYIGRYSKVGFLFRPVRIGGLLLGIDRYRY
jgi:hypothetical protein